MIVGIHDLHSFPMLKPEGVGPFLEEREIDPAAVVQYARLVAMSPKLGDSEELRLGTAFVTGFTMGLQAAEVVAGR